jgi:hypothetical protein
MGSGKMITTPIEIDQCLHGYSEGHRLLSYSTELSKEAQRTMLVMSDMSGPTMQTGFEEYITGYPIPNTRLYAFSKTWFAPEMSRPGCVWTHTLILPSEALQSIQDLRVLLQYFERPQSQSDFSSYSSRILLDQSSNPLLSQNNHLQTFAALVLSELYGHDKDYPVIFPVNDTQNLDNVVTAIWSQQWPALREHFAFCTGSISVRSINGNPFDLQFIPLNQRRQFEREIKDSKFVNSDVLLERAAPWHSALLQDVTLATNTPLRCFLKAFGNGSRHLMGNLTSFYIQYHDLKSNTMDARRIIDLFFSLFPDANSKNQDVVKCILGRQFRKEQTDLLGVSEYEMLFGLATYPNEINVATEYFNVRTRAQQLFNNDNSKAIDLLARIIKNRITPIGKEIFHGIASVLTTENLLYISTSQRELLFAIASAVPTIAAKPPVWKIVRPEHLTLLEAISTNNLSDLEKSAIITAIIEAGLSSISSQLLRKFGNGTIIELVAFMDSHDNLPGNLAEWSHILRDNPETVIDLLKTRKLNSAQTLVFIATGLEPRGIILDQQYTALWSHLLKQFENDMNEQSSYVLSCFFMPIALSTVGQDSNHLASFSFPFIHDALVKNQLDWKTWQFIEPLLPELPWHWFRSWDKCERLRTAMKKRGLLDIPYRNNKY